MAGKRSHGEGYVARSKNGRWRGQLMVGYHEDGRKHIVSFTADTKGEVLQKMRDYAQTAKARDSPREKTFSEWADAWYADYETQVAASTYSGYIFTLKILKKRFGERPLKEITPMEINNFLSDLVREKCSHSKISKCRAMLIQIFDSAEFNNLVERNPARRAKVIKEDAVADAGSRQGKDAFTREETEILLRELPDTMDGNGVRLLLGTGLRVQELLALTTEDIAEDGSRISVNKAVTIVGGRPVLGTTKSRKGVRIVPVPEDYRRYALYLREHGGMFFCIRSRRFAEPCSTGSFRKRYYAMLDSIDGVRRLTPHCCRHTYITALQANGVPMETIARLAGHSNISTTDGYLHIDEASLSEAVSVLNAERRN